MENAPAIHSSSEAFPASNMRFFRLLTINHKISSCLIISSARLRMVFKEYRREYKKRFARINAGKLTKSAFYAWSEEARRKKEYCDSGVISPEEFSRWLKES